VRNVRPDLQVCLGMVLHSYSKTCDLPEHCGSSVRAVLQDSWLEGHRDMVLLLGNVLVLVIFPP
jgi:hypothetical protein